MLSSQLSGKGDIPLLASLVAQRLKRLPPLRVTWVWSLGWEDPLEKEMVTHSSILAWKIPWTEEPGMPQSVGSQRVGHDWEASLSFTFYFHLQIGFPDNSVGKESACNAGDSVLLGRSTGEGTGNPLQYSWAFLVAQLVKNPSALWKTLGSIPRLGRYPGEGKGYPLQYSGLENCAISLRSYWPRFSCTATPITKGAWEMKYLSGQCLPEIWDL